MSLRCPARGLSAALVVLLVVLATPGAAGAAPAARTEGAAAELAACTEAPFTDVPVAHPFCAEITWAKVAGIVTGLPDGTFRPASAFTRQAMAATAVRAHLGAPPPACVAAPFTDVAVDHPFCGDIAWARDHGVVTGHPDGTFRPTVVITRREAATMFSRAQHPSSAPAACTDAPFADVAADDPFCAPIAWAAATSLFTGNPDGSFAPGAPFTRGAAAALWAREDAAFGGFVDQLWFADRQDEYLAYATEELSEGSITNVIAHLEQADRDPSFSYDPSTIDPGDFERTWEKIDGYEDTADFDMLYLTNLYQGYAERLSPEMRTKLEEVFVDFKYWYTDPTPEGFVDDRWYWSENHRIIFHTLEYLAGQSFPEATFTITGQTGAWHRDRAEGWIREWLEEKARFGFSEWHSDVYYQKDVTPLLTLVEFADDPAIAEPAAMVLDLVLFDLAMHTLDGNNGATHGRSYMKDKSRAHDQDVFGVVKLLFDATSEPYVSRGDAGAGLLARAARYRLPEVIHDAGTSTEPMIDHERMGVPFGTEGPLTTTPPEPYGISWTDPDNIPFWWDKGGLTAWPLVPTTLATIDQYGLWDSELFADYKAIADIVGDDYEAGRELAYQLRDLINVGLLDEVWTTTYRTGDVMLSSAQDFRFGASGDQYHAWQATLGSRATVFTTHPGNLPRAGDRWADGDKYWTGTGSMPRTAQVGPAALHLYAPAFESPEIELLSAFAYLDETHAYFPTEEFDEVVRSGSWTFGRHDGGYIALWSWRTPNWREHDGVTSNDNGLTEVFDLVAPGGPDNVWAVQVADADDWAGFEAFMAAFEAEPPTVVETPPGGDEGPHGGFEVTWDAPGVGQLGFGTLGDLTLDGSVVDLRPDARYDNPWAQVPFQSDLYQLATQDRRLVLDFDAWTRTAS